VARRAKPGEADRLTARWRNSERLFAVLIPIYVFFFRSFVLALFRLSDYGVPMEQVPGHNADKDTSGHAPPARARKGRGAASNRDGRFERYAREAEDDGWSTQEREAEEAERSPGHGLTTRVDRDSARSVITRNQSPDVPFDRSINPYRGCEHGCIYCFARPSHAYLGLSPGLDFESRIFAKEDAAALLRKELARPGYRPRPIALGANTDPYQPVERRMKITRGVMEVLAETNHPVTIVTKSHLVTRDIDLLAAMAEKNLARVAVSVTTLDSGLARVLEPRAPAPVRRLEAVRELARAGVPVGILMAPIIPAINDAEIERLLDKVAKAGAESANYVLLRLPLEIGPLFEEWLEAHYPDRKERVLNLLRETRGGRLYDSRWQKRQTGEGPFAWLIAHRFKLACRKSGLLHPSGGGDGRDHDRVDWELDCSRFEPPRTDTRQLSFL
jgi:DNA repair photolyase